MAASHALSESEIASFIERGFVAIEGAFSREIAGEVCDILWRGSKRDPADPTTWSSPYVRLNAYSDPPFLASASGPRLTTAFDQLVGQGRWLPLDSMATFPLRFPSPLPSRDIDWHIDMSFGPPTSDTLQWRANLASEGRALLLLFLFTDVDEHDAPTRIRVGSHRDVARLLADKGAKGMSLGELVRSGFGQDDVRPEELAVGPAGTVYLCHPFLVHAGQDNPRRPRFIGQPALVPHPDARQGGPFALSPVERAVQLALGAK